MKKNIRFLAMLLLASFPVFGSSASRADSLIDGSWQVELHVYSGRPDPIFVLNQLDAQKIKQIVASATVSKDAQVEVLPNLGYNGATIKHLDKDGRAVMEINVNKKQASILIGKVRSTLKIPSNSNVERILLDLAYSQGIISKVIYESAIAGL